MSGNEEKVKEIIEKELGVEREKLTDDANFIEDLVQTASTSSSWSWSSRRNSISTSRMKTLRS
jgi:hypothetical protein